jgi:hypothetical protein
MKRNSSSLFGRAAAVCLLLGLASLASLAQERIRLSFPNAASVTSNWSHWWGSATNTITFDSIMDAALNPNSGSMKVTADFNLASFGGDNQFALRGALSGNGDINGGTAKIIDATQYDRLEFDLWWDNSSPQRPNGDFGYLELGLVPTDFSQLMLPGINVPFVDGWQHFSISFTNLNKNDPKMKLVSGLIIKMWAGNTDNALTGRSTFWVDNIQIVPKGFITGFDSDAFLTPGRSAFWNWWGGAARTVEFDPTQDGKGDTNSGSIKISVTYDNTLGDNQYSEGMSLSGHNSYNRERIIRTADYQALEFDLLFDTNSTLSTNIINTQSDNGLAINLGLNTPNFDFFTIPNSRQPKVVADGQWHHVSIPLDPSWGDIAAIVFKKWEPSGAGAPSGTMNYWVDNFRFIPSSAPLPPPKLNLTTAVPGLNLFYSQANGQYQRQGVRVRAADFYNWIGSPVPVTYSFNIADFPNGTTNRSPQAHIFLAPDTGGGTAPDYSDPNAILLEIHATTNNLGTGGFATFRYKTNQPNGNSMLFTGPNTNNLPVGSLASLATPSVRGTWSLTFSNDTNVTLTGPGNVSTNFNMPAPSAQMFLASGSMGVYFGSQPNDVSMVGRSVTFSNITVTAGTDVVVNDSFTNAPLDTTVFQIRSDSGGAGTMVVNETPAYWLSWGLPDNDFVLYASTNLNSPAFTLATTNFNNGGATKQMLITPSTVTNAQNAFFFLAKPGTP